MIRCGMIAASLVAGVVVPRPAFADRSHAASAAKEDRSNPLPPPPAARAMEAWAKAWGFKWDELAFVPGPELSEEVREAWSWLVPGRWRPILCATVGGIFIESEAGTVSWLDIGAGTVEEVAPNVEAFEGILRSEAPVVQLWFLPALVEELHRAGKRPRPGQAYSFLILPVFAEGKFAADNMFVAPAREQLLLAADIHRQLVPVPDGAKVELVPTGRKGKRRPGG